MNSNTTHNTALINLMMGLSLKCDDDEKQKQKHKNKNKQKKIITRAHTKIELPHRHSHTTVCPTTNKRTTEFCETPFFT